MTSHTNSHQHSQHLCDRLLECLRAKESDIKRKSTENVCAFSHSSKAFAAHIYHYKSSKITVYCWHKPSSIADLPSQFGFQTRSVSKKGWADRFPHHFKIESLEDVEEAVNFLFNIAEANKKQVSTTQETNINKIQNLFPDQVDDEVTLREGAKYKITVNAYERNEKARKQCIKHYGTRCEICDFSFGDKYGQIAEGFIHVHHLRPLSELGAEYKVDPVKDLRPVCPNCHAVLHLHKTAFSIQEVKDMLQQQKTIKKL